MQNPCNPLRIRHDRLRNKINRTHHKKCTGNNKNERKKDGYLEVGWDLQRSILQERAPLWSHEYVSTATEQPSRSFMWIGAITDFSRGKSPWIPIVLPAEKHQSFTASITLNWGLKGKRFIPNLGREDVEDGGNITGLLEMKTSYYHLHPLGL